MKKKILLLNIFAIFTLLTVFSDSKVIAQNVAINTTGTALNTSAGLDVDFTNKGLLIPRVALASATDAATITSPATSLLVFNTNAALSGGTGFYYNNGTPGSPLWVQFKKQTEVYYVSATGGTTVSNGAPGPNAIPGVTKTITIPAGFTADIQVFSTIGGSISSVAAGAQDLIDFILFENGAVTAVGGYSRFSIVNSSAGGNAFNTSAISTTEVGKTAGVYTYLIGVLRVSGTAGVTATLGGNCVTTTNCGEMTIIVNYK